MLHLARRGQSVVGIEQYRLGHSLGSSSSGSRGFRKAYSTHPSYVTLANAAQAAWRELEAETGETLLHLISALTIGPPDHPGVIGLLRSAKDHGLPYEVLEAPALAARYPALVPRDGDLGVLEVDAGVLVATRCNEAHLRAALGLGAEVHGEERVLSLEPGPSEVVVRTDRAQYAARHVVVTAGPWLGALLGRGGLMELALPLRIERQVELWFTPPEATEDFDASRLPLFHFVLGDRAYYGVPQLDGQGIKVGRHQGGRAVTAATLDRRVSQEDEEDVRTFIRAHLPRAEGRLRHAKVCMDANTPDMHFVVGPHPSDERIILAGGFSGHGFKFAPIIGEIAADLATTGTTRHAIELFSPRRFCA
jgi:sarcosine oxidase